MDAKIASSIWRDDAITGEGDPKTTLVALWLLTNSGRDYCGVVKFSARHFQFETGLALSDFERAYEALSKPLTSPYGFAISPSEGLYVITKFIQFQFGTDYSKLLKDNRFRCVHKAFTKWQGTPTGKVLAEIYPALFIYDEKSDRTQPNEALIKGSARLGKARLGEDKKGSVRENITQQTPCDLRFDEFWSRYPVKKGKGAARKAWTKLHSADQAICIEAIAVQVAHDHFTGADGRAYVPHAVTWLNQGRWEDEVSGVAQIANMNESQDTQIPPPDGWQSALRRLVGQRYPNKTKSLSEGEFDSWHLVPEFLRHELVDFIQNEGEGDRNGG